MDEAQQQSQVLPTAKRLDIPLAMPAMARAKLRKLPACRVADARFETAYSTFSLGWLSAPPEHMPHGTR